MEFRALGPLEVVDAETGLVNLGGLRQRAVLAALLVRAGEVVSLDSIVDAVWADDPPASPKGAVQASISRLRKVLGADAIQLRDPGYVLRLGPDDYDVQLVDRLTGEGRRAHEAGRLASAVELYDQALSWWRGDAFSDFRYDAFAAAEVARLDELRSVIRERRLAAEVERGRHLDVVPEIEQLLGEHPLREGVWGTYLLALYRAGRQADALRAYRTAATTLGEELGVEPSPELRRLEEQILLQSPELDAPSVASPLPQGEVTFVVADVGGAFLELDEAATAAALEGFTSAVSDEGGTVVRATFEQCIAAFLQPGPGISAALSAQRRSGDTVLAIGVHSAVAQVRAGEYVGRELSRAVRVAVSAIGGQVLMTGDEAGLAGVPLPEGAHLEALRPRTLPGLSAPQRLVAISHPDLVPVSAATRVVPTNLPARHLTSFVGRDVELGEVRALCERGRLVTLTGPGGVGKTRLAVQAASDLVGRHPDGVWLVELAHVPIGGGVAEAIVDAIGLEIEPGQGAADALRSGLATQESLLVLDNAEHLLDKTADVVEPLLFSCPRVTVLVTSRERLGVGGERTFVVPRLAVPDRDEVLDLGIAAETYEAVELFVNRAEAFVDASAIDDLKVADVVTICRRLDGIPLAIELAAARLDVLSAGEIAARLDDRFSLLGASRRHGRQQTLEAAIDWSYELLDEDERRLFCALTVFDAGCTIGAVEAIYEVVQAARPVVDLLAALVRKSLVAIEPTPDGERRYELLETIAAFAARLLDPTLAGELRVAHARFYADLVRQVDGQMRGEEVEEAAAIFRRDFENIRTAVEWYAAHDPSGGLDLLTGVADCMMLMGAVAEGARWADRLLSAYDGPDTQELAEAARAAGSLAYKTGDTDAAQRWWEASARTSEAVGDSMGYVRAMNNLAVMTVELGRYDQGVRAFRAVRRSLPQDADPRIVVYVESNLSMADLKAGNLDRALEGAANVHRTAQLLGDRRQVADTIGNIGLVCWCRADLDEAERATSESIALSRELDDREHLSEPLKVLAEVRVAQGRWREAISPAREALELRSAGDRVDLADYLETIAGLVAASGELAIAVRLLAAARTAKGRVDAAPVSPEEQARRGWIEAAHGDLGEGFGTAWQEGAAIGLAAALDLGRSAVDAI